MLGMAWRDRGIEGVFNGYKTKGKKIQKKFTRDSPLTSSTKGVAREMNAILSHFLLANIFLFFSWLCLQYCHYHMQMGKTLRNANVCRRRERFVELPTLTFPAYYEMLMYAVHRKRFGELSTLTFSSYITEKHSII